jgi:formate hydrogenlyase subunit 3/multisubunit Na+/H+ antiporter MnhD subunit
LIASILFFPVFLLTSALDNNRSLKLLDFVYHIILGLILLVASSLMLKSAVDSNEPFNSSYESLGQQYYDKKVAAGSFGIINSLVYFAASVFVITSQNEDDYTTNTRYSK